MIPVVSTFAQIPKPLATKSQTSPLSDKYGLIIETYNLLIKNELILTSPLYNLIIYKLIVIYYVKLHY